jgi:orotidine-5'-phosphate decarboxylase
MTATYEQLASRTNNPLAKRLLSIIIEKQTNLCVSVDVTSPEELVSIIQKVGKHVCMIKVFPSVKLFTYDRRMSILYRHFQTP